MGIKKDILLRINIIFIVLCILATLIFAQAFKIQVIEGEKWREMGKRNYKIEDTTGTRGNIYSEDGRLLSTSMPLFSLHWDNTFLPDSVYAAHVDSLCLLLSELYPDTNPEEYKANFDEKRRQGNAYVLIQRRTNYAELQRIKQLSIFNKSKYKRGLIIDPYYQRLAPFGSLGRRTIGYPIGGKEDTIIFSGVEGFYGSYLIGKPLRRIIRRVAGSDWIAINDDFQTGEYEGNDVYTTIDINLQEVVENALLTTLRQHQAAYGCAVVMETATGKIKAIANLGRDTTNNSSPDDTYSERYNYAVGELSEMGSTFKVASLTALLDHNFVTDTTQVDLEWGKKKFYDKLMTDSHPPNQSKETVRRIMETSSNVGIAKLVDRFYGKNPNKFVDKLRSMHLDQLSGIDIIGEQHPMIKNPSSTDWSGVTLPWMSIGYEVKLTPLQLLTFYNAIANDGKMMKPYLVTDVKDEQRVIRHYNPTVLEKQICRPETAQKVRDILKGVLEEGTAKALYTPDFSIAGKTGTAKIAKNREGYKEIYQASIAGFFPAEKPVYSCIVVINSPTQGDYYGASVAGPVFKEIIQKCYALSYKYQTPINQKPIPDTLRSLPPIAKNGYGADLMRLYQKLGVSCQYAPTEWQTVSRSHDSIYTYRLSMSEKAVPNVMGMGLRDAVYVLEKNRLKVRFNGRGKVIKQQPQSGSSYKQGQTVYIELR